MERAGSKNLRERPTSGWLWSSMTSPSIRSEIQGPVCPTKRDAAGGGPQERPDGHDACRSCRRCRLLKRFDGMSRGLPALKTFLIGAHVCVAELA